MWAKIGELWLQTHIAIFFVCNFVSTYMYNLKTKSRKRITYLSNDCSTIGDTYFVGYGSKWDTIGELCIQTLNATTFWYDILCIVTLITLKLQVLYGHCTYWMTPVLLDMSIFCVRAGQEIQLASYGSKHALQCHFDKPYMHTYMSNMKSTGHVWTLCILNSRSTTHVSETFLVSFRFAWEI